jgi:hypothetical protein
VFRVRVVRLWRSPGSHLLSQLPGRRPLSPTKFCGSTIAVLDTIEQGKRTWLDEDNLEIDMNQWAHLYFYLLSSERGRRGSHLSSTIRLRSLVEGPARPREQVAVVIEQPSKSHNGLTAVNAAGVPPRSIMPAFREGTARPATDQVCGTRARRGWRPPDASATACQLPARWAVWLRRWHATAVQHRLDKPEKMHRPFGSRLAQQVVRHVDYDTEHGFNLPCR